MSEAFRSYPVLSSSHLNTLGYVSDPPEFSYLDNYEEYPLSLDKTGENSINFNGSIRDPRCQWHPDRHDIKIARNCRLTSAYCLFGEHGITSHDATLGLALRWISTKSDERGIIPFGSITASDSTSSYHVEQRFEKGRLRGSIKLDTVLYLKDAGHPKPSERFFAQQPGTILGELDHQEIYIDGNGSLFPIVVIDAPGETLWKVYYSDSADPMQDKFDNDNVEIQLNRAHPYFNDLKIESSIGESPLFLEVITAAMVVIVEAAKENIGAEWDDVLKGTGYESGSIAEAINYFITRLGWDISSPATLSHSIKKFFELNN